MSSSFKVTVPVITEPITLSSAKSYLRVDYADEDTDIQSFITRARAHAETITHRALATQTVQTVFTIERPGGGELSGPLNQGPNWYQYQEQLGANPFGAAQFYFDLPMPPIQSAQTITIETKVTAFDAWQAFTGNTYIDDNIEPARMYFQVPVTANFWRFTYTCGYNTSYPIPNELLQPIYELISHFYEHRDQDPGIPEGITNKLLAKRVDWI